RAILRPGRFDRLIEVPKPDAPGRERILEIHTKDMNLAESVDFEALAAETEDFNGAQLASLTTEAGMFAIRDGREAVEYEDFKRALEKLAEESDSPTHASYIY
ncbi:MAG: peptidase, partial [Halobacteriaceae archaeon]